MPKKLANKQTKELMAEDAIREKSLRKDDFTTNWQGRVYISNPDKSEVAKKMSIAEKGEFAIKVK